MSQRGVILTCNQLKSIAIVSETKFKGRYIRRKRLLTIRTLTIFNVIFRIIIKIPLYETSTSSREQ